MSVFHSQFRGDFADLAGKVDGDDYPSDLVSKKYKAAHESGDPHQGAVVGIVEYDGGEFHVRLYVGGRDWHFRGLSVETLRDQVYRFFSADRGRIKLKFSRSADLARHGEANAIARL